MKKIFTLLVSVTMVASAFAQYDAGKRNNNGYDKGNTKANDVVYNDNSYKKGNDRFDDHYSFSKRDMDMKIAEINREYDKKIKAVKFNFFMPVFKKQMMVRKLEDQRQDEIKAVYFKFSDRRNRFGDYDQKKHW